jgi:L-lactate dehydrogenase complex protein LldG
LDAFIAALAKGGGEAVRFQDEKQASEWLAGFARDFAHAAVSADVPRSLRPDIPEAPVPTAALGVSLALAAAANTGSLLISSREGRRLQLLPPVHLIWIDPTRVYSDLGRALEGVRDEGELPAVLALHSGPSKSADIGRILVTGVHGPGRLIAAIVPSSSQAL